MVFLFEIQLTPKGALINLNLAYIGVVRQRSVIAGPKGRPSIRKEGGRMKRITGILFAVVLGFAFLSSCYYPCWRGYYPYYWGVGWPYGYYGGWPYVGWPYYPLAAAQSPPAYNQSAQRYSYYWYYCQDPQGYYPYIKNCPGGWITVVPKMTPPNQ